MNKVNESLGIQKMPEGYDLMRRDDKAYYWVKSGSESVGCISMDKWAVYRSAVADSRANKPGNS